MKGLRPKMKFGRNPKYNEEGSISTGQIQFCSTSGTFCLYYFFCKFYTMSQLNIIEKKSIFHYKALESLAQKLGIQAYKRIIFCVFTYSSSRNACTCLNVVRTLGFIYHSLCTYLLPILHIIACTKQILIWPKHSNKREPVLNTSCFDKCLYVVHITSHYFSCRYKNSVCSFYAGSKNIQDFWVIFSCAK